MIPMSLTMLSERCVVIAREYLEDKNINDSREIQEPIFNSKLSSFNWSPAFGAASVFCEMVWKKTLGRESSGEWRQLDRLFSPSPIATHANFRGCRDYKSGNIPELGALAIWRRGNSWQGSIGIVSEVSEDKETFSIIEGRAFVGSEKEGLIQVLESKGKKINLPFRNDKGNLLGFIYMKYEEIR